MFWNLGGATLWFDECSIAALGENTLKFGYPKALYNSVPIWSHKGYGPGYAYISRPWLDIYIAALGQFIFGKTNFAARIFFALFGYLSIILTYILAKKLFRENKLIPFLSVLLLGTSVPFLLQMRQCAYYSLVAFATLWTILSYLNLLKAKKYSFTIFLSSLVFFIFANHGVFIMVFLGCLGHHAFLVKEKKAAGYLMVSAIFSGLLLIPIAFYTKGITGFKLNILSQVYPNISYYIRAINKYILPYRFYVLAAFVFLALKTGRFINFLKREKENWKAMCLFLSIFIVSLIVLTVEQHRFLRYIINLAPLFMIIHAYIISKFIKWNKALGVLILVLVVFTNMLNESGFYLLIRPFRPNSRKIIKKAEIKTFLFSYIYEITHEYEGPITGIVNYLNKNAKTGDTFKTPYNVAGIMYYTGLTGQKDFSEETYPEWIIPRRGWLPEGFYKSAYYKNILNRYEAVNLNVSDIPWENRPDDLEYHKFKTVKEGAPLVIFRRK